MKKFFLYKKMNSYSNYKIEMISSKYITQTIKIKINKMLNLKLIIIALFLKKKKFIFYKK